MILETALQIVIYVTVILGVLAFFVYRYFRRKKQKKLVENDVFVKNFFQKYPELRADEYLPYKGKSINNKKESIFLAKSFLIFVENAKIVKLEYTDIYWTYGEVRGSVKTKNYKAIGENIVLKTKYGTYRVLVKNQEPYIVYLNSLGIPAGYSDDARELAKKRKNELKRQKNGKKGSK